VRAPDFMGRQSRIADAEHFAENYCSGDLILVSAS
jgi:hypothetical protein